MDKTTQLIVAVILSVIISTLIGVALMAAGVNETLQQSLGAPAAADENTSGDDTHTVKRLQTRLAEAETRISDLEGAGDEPGDLNDILSRLASLERSNRELEAERNSLKADLDALKGSLTSLSTDGGASITDEQLAELSSDPAMAAVVERLAEQMRDTAASVYDDKQLEERVERITQQREGTRGWIENGFGRMIEGYNQRATENGSVPIDEYTSEELNKLTLDYYDKYTELTISSVQGGWDDETVAAQREALSASLQEDVGALVADPTQAEEVGSIVQRMASGTGGRGGFGGGRTRQGGPGGGRD